MQVIASEDLAWFDYPGQLIRAIKYQALFQGAPNSSDNFELSIVRMGEDGVYFHRHWIWREPR